MKGGIFSGVRSSVPYVYKDLVMAGKNKNKYEAFQNIGHWEREVIHFNAGSE